MTIGIPIKFDTVICELNAANNDKCFFEIRILKPT